MDFTNIFKVKNYWGVRPWTRHSLVLVVAGFAYIAIGIAYYVSNVAPEREVALEVALQWMSLDYWGILFIAVGCLAALSSRWPPFADTWGYMALTGISAGWGSTYALSIIFGNSPLTNATSAILWSLVAFMWWGISGLINPDRVVVAVIHGSG